MRNREKWTQNVNPIWDISQIHVCHRKIDPENLGAAKIPGNRERR